jgi:hypothetical protein
MQWRRAMAGKLSASVGGATVVLGRYLPGHGVRVARAGVRDKDGVV